MTFCGKSESLLFNFPRTRDQRAPGRSSRHRWVPDYGRIDRGDGSISFIMHDRKRLAVFPSSQSCSEGGQRCGRVRRRSVAAPLVALCATLGRWEDCEALSIVQCERDRAAPPLNSTVILNRFTGTWSPGDELGDPI